MKTLAVGKIIKTTILCGAVVTFCALAVFAFLKLEDEWRDEPAFSPGQHPQLTQQTDAEPTDITVRSERQQGKEMEFSPIDSTVTDFIAKIRIGDLQVWKNVAIAPLFLPDRDEPNYLTLEQALHTEVLEVSELEGPANVHALRVINRSDRTIFIMDGEELQGGKQNRVLDMTIALAGGSEKTIPVSCTEAGRWVGRSRRFHASGNALSSVIRERKVFKSVIGLRRGSNLPVALRSYQSDQWEMLACSSERMGVISPTRAMAEIYETKDEHLSEYVDNLPCHPAQKGIVVFINGKIVGFDFVASETAYEKLHTKLVKSYALEALLDNNEDAPAASPDNAKAFIRQAVLCKQLRSSSVGLGDDYRFDGSAVVGTGLVIDGNVLHLAFFATGKGTKGE